MKNFIYFIGFLGILLFAYYLGGKHTQQDYSGIKLPYIECPEQSVLLRYKGAVVERDKDDIEAFYIHVKDSLALNTLHLSGVKGLKLVRVSPKLDGGDKLEQDPYLLFVRIGAAFQQDSVLMEIIDIVNESKVKHGK